MTRLMIERLYGWSAEISAAGKWSYYGKVGGILVTGNKDGGKHCASQILYAFSHIGCTIPPQADSYWKGDAGPGAVVPRRQPRGPQQLDARNTVFASWNMLHTARTVKDAGGIPVTATSRSNWDLSSPTTRTPTIDDERQRASSQVECVAIFIDLGSAGVSSPWTSTG